MKKYLSIIYMALLAMGLSSCRILQRGEISFNRTAYIDSDVFVLYYPYHRNEHYYKLSNPKLKHGFSPIADYNAWHTEKMDNDLNEMKLANIDGVFICLSPMDMADKEKRDMIGHFLEKCSSIGFKAVIILAAEAPVAMKLDNVISYICSRAWDKSPAMYRIDGKIPLGFSNAITLHIEGENTIFSPFFIQEADGSNAKALPCPFDLVKSASSPETMHKDRSRGHHLIESLSAALDKGSQRIVISSWNVYSDGTAIEKNTFDYDAQLKVLR